MIIIRKEKLSLILIYDTDQNDNGWVYRELNKINKVRIKNTFFPTKKELWGYSAKEQVNEEEPVEFRIAEKEGEYYKVNKNVLLIENDLFIHKDITLNPNTFTAIGNISIFSKLDELADEDVFIGGDAENHIPEEDFYTLIRNYPNRYELKKYSMARIGSVIRTYLDTKIDAEQNYRKYMNKKTGNVGVDVHRYFSDIETFKYTTLYEKLIKMLDNENTYTEKQWQLEILQIILLLYPKYIHVFKEAPVRDTYSLKDRNVDFLLVDATGNTDIVEIKQPFDQCIVTKSTYRDNYIPLRELSGTVMQIEKYIFYLNKWGKRGEEMLTKRYIKELPVDFKIKITNPCGIIVMGRDSNLSDEQKQDFEVIKRKYKNVIDIITYDDLLNRLKFTIEQWSKNK